MNTHIRKITIVLAALLLFAPSMASALDIPLVDLRIGLRGGPNVNILPEVDENDPEPVYPGFAGIGWFIGGALSFDYLSIIGISIELLYSNEQATGSAEYDEDLGTDQKKEESEFILSNTALHLPIYIRAQVPGGVARPFVHVGVDFAFNRSNHDLTVEQRGDAPPFDGTCDPSIPTIDQPGQTPCEVDPFPDRLYVVDGVDSSTSVLVGLGLDIDVGPVTIPIEFRGLIRPSFDSSITERTVIDTSGDFVTYRYENEWQYQVFVLFGVNYVIF
ncbi:MAG: hypothetical protein KC561_02330 [Myxococcales bacterium]|nr:hypothetical protein [Myxococcales bacterium]